MVASVMHCSPRNCFFPAAVAIIKHSKIAATAFGILFCLGVILAACSASYNWSIWVVYAATALSSISVSCLAIHCFSNVGNSLVTKRAAIINALRNNRYQEAFYLSRYLSHYQKVVILQTTDEWHLRKAMIVHIFAAADLERKDNLGRTLLLSTYLLGDFEVARLLLEKGANPKATDSMGQTLFHITAEKNLSNFDVQFEFLNACAQNGLDINQRDNNGNSPLDLMAKNDLIDPKNLGIFKLFARLGADFYSKDANGRSALHYACRNMNHGLLREFLKVMPVDKPENFEWRDYEGNTPLHSLNMTLHLNEILPLLQKIDPNLLNIQDNEGRTLLHIFAYVCSLPAFESALRFGADCSVVDKKGKVAFEYVGHHLGDFLQTAQPYLKENDIQKLYQHAICRRNSVFLKVLLENGFPFEIPNLEGKIPLTLALESGYLPNIALLIHFMASVKERVVLYDEQLQEAAKKGKVREKVLATCYQKDGRYFFESFFHTALDGNEPGFDFYLKAGFFPTEWTDNLGLSALHLAAAACQPQIIRKCKNLGRTSLRLQRNLLHSVGAFKWQTGKGEKLIDLLIKEGVNPNEEHTVNNYGEVIKVTPLEWYVIEGREEAMKALTQYANLDRGSIDRAFAMAVLNGSMKNVIQLRKLGADINKEWLALGSRPLHIAAMCGHKYIALQLIEWGADTSKLDKDHKLYWHYFENSDALNDFVKNEIDRKNFQKNGFALLPAEITDLILSQVGSKNLKRVCKGWKALIEKKVSTSHAVPKVSENSLEKMKNATLHTIESNLTLIQIINIKIRDHYKLNIPSIFDPYLSSRKSLQIFKDLETLRKELQYENRRFIVKSREMTEQEIESILTFLKKCHADLNSLLENLNLQNKFDENFIKALLTAAKERENNFNRILKPASVS